MELIRRSARHRLSPVVINANDYYAFGSQMVGRTFAQSNAIYRYGFNGKENDNEVKGEGNQQDYGMRIYDPRIGRFLSVDPIAKDYPWYTPYQFAGNKPIIAIDLDGEEESIRINYHSSGLTKTEIVKVNNKLTEQLSFRLWEVLTGRKAGKISENNSFWTKGFDAYSDQTHYLNNPQKGELTIDVYGNNYMLGYSKDINKDNIYDVKSREYALGDSYDRAAGLNAIGSGISDLGIKSYIIPVLGEVVGPILSGVGGLVSTIGDGSELLVDLADGKTNKKKAGFFAANQAIGIATGFIKDKASGKLAENIAGKGVDQIKSSVIGEEKKPSARKIIDGWIKALKSLIDVK